MSIYEQLKALNIPMDHHESDLHVPVTPETRKIVNAYEFRSIVTTFISNTEKTLWYNIPFAYMPFWERKVK